MRRSFVTRLTQPSALTFLLSGCGGGSTDGSAASASKHESTQHTAPADEGAGSKADGGSTSASARTMQPIDPPVADGCITDVGAGDHTFSCSGLTFLVMVDEQCTRSACGLIFDVHGELMSGAQMRDNTKLHELAPSKGYLVVHPSATANNTGGTWDLTADPPKVADFMQRMINAFHVDPKRVHFTGFSQGGAMTWFMLCNHNDWLASAAPIAGALISRPSMGVSALGPCFDSSWSPRVPILNMNGISDRASTIADSRMLIDGVVSVLGLTGGDQVDGDGHYTVTRYEGDGAILLDVIEHDYTGQLGGHCIPGGTDVNGSPNNFGMNATTCTTVDPKLNWGPYVLDWFLAHEKR